MAGPADKLFSGVVPDFIRLFDNNVEQAEPVVESPPNLARRDLKRTTEFPITSMAQGNTHPANMREVNGGAQRAVTEQEREAGMNTFYQDISVDRLRAYMASRQEYEYVLVDVRQPDEYAQGHIPGAVLIPLGEVSERISELPVDKDVVLYCRSGKRSRAAALFIASRPYVAGTLFNMTGGILAWNGQSQPAIPNLKVFELDGSNQEALYQAMDVERGADFLHGPARSLPGRFLGARAGRAVRGRGGACPAFLSTLGGRGNRVPFLCRSLYRSCGRHFRRWSQLQLVAGNHGGTTA